MKDIKKIQEFFSKPLNEEETAIDMAKKQLDALGVKYELGDKFRPFTAIYKPTDMTDDWYDDFDEIIYLFNLGSAVKRAMNEASPLTKLSRKIGWAGEDWTPQEFASQIKKLPNETLLKWAEGNKGISNTPLAFQQKLVKIELAKRGLTESSEQKYSVKPSKKGFSVIKTSTGSEITSFDTEERAKQHVEKLNKMKFIPKEKFNEAKEEDAVDTITMDIPLFLRMLEYSREDASQDMDLHDVTEKAISLGKERGILQMDDYNEIIGTTEKVNEVNLKTSKLSSAEYQKAKKLKDFKASDWKWNADEDLYTKIIKENKDIEVGDIVSKKYASTDEDYTKEFKVIGITGMRATLQDTKTGKQTGIALSDLIKIPMKEATTDYMKRRKAMDDYATSKKDKPAKSYNPNPSGKTDYMKRRQKDLTETIFSKLTEKKSTPCWNGYEQIGMKEKDGKQVPNCVPKK
jgi:hypothetical protein